jgi:molybdopterin synthase sulfur carrier subunit
MARVSVRMYATVREASGRDEVSVDASTLAEALGALSGMAAPEFRRLLQSYGLEDGGIVVLVNGMNMSSADPVSVGLSDGDEIAIFPPVSGG